MNRRGLATRVRERGREALARRLGIDVRALAAFRVSIGLLLLADLALRSRDLVAFYTDAGVLPRAALREGFPGLSRLSLHALSGSVWVQVVLFAVAAVAALSLLVGYRTAAAAVVSWILLVSLHARNPIVLNAGDSLLRRLLFWGLFLPLGERWSVDALDGTDSRRRVTSVASAALLCQVLVVYVVNAVFKLRGDLWLSGDAIRYVFSLEQFTVRLGDYLATAPELLGLLSTVWLAMLAGSVLLVGLTGRSRAVLVALFAAMHFGMFLTMHLGLFPFVSIAGLVPFLPAVVWTAAAERLRGIRTLFDATAWQSRARRLPTGPDLPAPAAAKRWNRRATPAVVGVLLALIVVWNAATLGAVALPQGVDSVADPDEHRWDMFAPEPRTTDGWYVVPGRLASGRTVDIRHGGPVEWDKPPDVSRTYPNVRWLAYLVDLQREPYAEFRPHLADYFCDRWNARHDDELVELTLYYVEQPTRLDGPEPTRRVELLEYGCSQGVRTT